MESLPRRDRRTRRPGRAGSTDSTTLLKSEEHMSGTDRRTEGELLERTKQETKKPELYKVFLLNDDYTTMDFVVEVLETIFNKQPAEAFRIMMMVHTQGRGLCGLYPHEVAETKVDTVIERARESGFPLRAAMEPE
jgi:ATP-dependent Clp protease adaptor protein ClpS